jgi:hypothetical protein
VALIDIVQDAALRCNIPVPASAAGVADTDVQKLIAFAQDAGDDAVERWGWLNTKAAGTVTGDGTTTLWTLPAGFQSFNPSTVLISSVSPTLPLRGPINEEDLLQIKKLAWTPVPGVWRRIGTQLEIYPAPASGEVISYVYASKLWITNSSGVANATGRWAADTDLSLIPERVVRLGCIWRFKRNKGLDYSQEFEDYESALDLNAGAENTERVISMSSEPVINTDDDSWFPGTITYAGP